MMPAAFSGGGNPSGFNPSGGALSLDAPHMALLPAPFPTGQTMPPITSPFAAIRRGTDSFSGVPGTGTPGSGDPSGSFGANTAGTIPTNLGSPAVGSSNGPAADLGFQGGNLNAITDAFKKAGFSQGIASLLTTFLSSGAGFNPQIAQALINAMQPQVSRGEAQIQEQFGAEGLGASSPAAIGMGDFLSQVNLNEQQIFAQMQEQAIQNYMQVLLAGKAPPKTSGLGALLGGAGSLISGLAGGGGLGSIISAIQGIFNSGGGDSQSAPTGGDPGVLTGTLG